MEKISIQTVPVTIRVMEVGGKRMTLAVFNQIQADDFFGEEITDEDRESSFIGWVSHKDEKYILFHLYGNLKKDLYEHQKVGQYTKICYENRKNSLEAAKRVGAETQRQVDEFEKAKKDYDDEVAYCFKVNKQYVERFTDETQIFIAI